MLSYAECHVELEADAYDEAAGMYNSMSLHLLLVIAFGLIRLP